MYSFAQVSITGMIVRNAELKIVGDNKELLEFTVVTNASKKVNGEWESVGTFWKCKLWGKQAATLADLATKKARASVVGGCTAEYYVDNNGHDKMQMVVNADKVVVFNGDVGDGSEDEVSEPIKATATAGVKLVKKSSSKESKLYKSPNPEGDTLTDKVKKAFDATESKSESDIDWDDVPF